MLQSSNYNCWMGFKFLCKIDYIYICQHNSFNYFFFFFCWIVTLKKKKVFSHDIIQTQYKTERTEIRYGEMKQGNGKCFFTKVRQLKFS